MSSSLAHLPPELLLSIFTHVLPAHTVDAAPVPVIGRRTGRKGQKHVYALVGVWAIAQVCRSWRSLAIGYGPLWAAFVLPTSLTKNAVPLLAAQLDRAGPEAPLDVLLWFTGGYHSNDQMSWFAQALARLTEQRARWRRLVIVVASLAQVPDGFFEAGIRDVPLLEELVFSGEGVAYVDPELVVENAPRLSRVLLGDAWSAPMTNISLPWHQVTRYKACEVVLPIEPVKHREFLHAAAGALVDADIGFDEVDPEVLAAKAGGEPIVLPRLQRLAIANTGFLAALTTPSLTELYVIQDIDPVAPFLLRSQCTLTYLTLESLTKYTDPADIISLLEHAPALTHLAIDYTADWEEMQALLAALTVHPADPLLCPRLSTFSLADPAGTLGPQRTGDLRADLVDFVRSRSAAADKGFCAKVVEVNVYGKRLRLRTAAHRMRQHGVLRIDNRMGKEGRRAVERWRRYREEY